MSWGYAPPTQQIILSCWLDKQQTNVRVLAPDWIPKKGEVAMVQVEPFGQHAESGEVFEVFVLGVDKQKHVLETL